VRFFACLFAAAPLFWIALWAPYARPAVCRRRLLRYPCACRTSLPLCLLFGAYWDGAAYILLSFYAFAALFSRRALRRRSGPVLPIASGPSGLPHLRGGQGGEG
jgi:hypothetical protein